MRSLLLAPSFPPSSGGMEMLLYQTARRLPVPPLVLAPRPAQAPDIRVRSIRTTPGGRPGRGLYRAGWALHPSLHYTMSFWSAAVDAARTYRPDVVQAGHVYLAPLAWLLARRLRKPFVVYAFGQEVWRHGRPMGVAPVDALLRGSALARADAVLALGSFTASLLRDWSVPPRLVVRVPFGAQPRPPATAPTGSTLLSVGRLVPRKGVDTVIRAMPALAPTFPGIAYRVVGAGPDEGRLRQLAAALGVSERVTFLGRLGEEALGQEFRRSALFVQPSRRTADGELEGLGLVYFEAAAWGRPAVAGRSGGEGDAVVDGVTGVLVDGRSVEAVAAAISGLLSNPARLREYGAAARRRLEAGYTWDHAAAVVNDVLERVRGLPWAGPC